MRSSALLVVALALVSTALASACIPRLPKQRLDARAPIAVGLIVDPQFSGEATTVPESLRAAVKAELADHNLELVEVPLAALKAQRLSDGRFGALKAASPQPFTLLVEVRVHFFSQLDGRYRWEVGTNLTAGRADGAVARDPFEVPVVLMYDHEKETEAISAAAADIATRVGALMDGLIAGAGKVPPAASPADAAPPGPSGATSRPNAIYFVMVDRFANGDSKNDGDADLKDPSAFHGGDLAGLIGRLDWLAKLGVDTVWLSPVFKMRTEKWFEHGAFHGYWTWRLDEVEPRFGDEALLTRLADELHGRGMRLLLDVVLNHVGPGAPLLTEHPDWFHRRGGVTDWNSVEQLETFDVHGLPDLAQEKPEVAAYLLGATRRWLRARET